MKDDKDKKEENKEHADMKEFMSALYKLIVAKTEEFRIRIQIKQAIHEGSWNWC